jgi:hypothetical protein
MFGIYLEVNTGRKWIECEGSQTDGLYFGKQPSGHAPADSCYVT